VGTQCAPPSRLAKTPALLVPAKTDNGFVGSTARARISPPSGPIGVHRFRAAGAADAHVIAARNAAGRIDGNRLQAGRPCGLLRHLMPTNDVKLISPP
jgi:hypothetical protein